MIKKLISANELDKSQKLSLEMAIGLIDHLFEIGQMKGEKPTRKEMENEFLKQINKGLK